MPLRQTILLCLALLVGTVCTAATPKPAKPLEVSFPAASFAPDSSSSIIPFNRVGNLIVIQARVDTTDGNFILDTGAPHLVLNLTYFRDYPVSVRPDAEEATVAGRGGLQQHTTAARLNFGNLEFFNLDADLTNLGNIENARGIKVLGLLGLKLFERCEVIIDFEKSQLLVHRIGKKEADSYEHESLKDTSAYRCFPIEFLNNRMATTAEVGGKKLKLVIDCAAEATILDSRLPNNVFEQITITRRTRVTGPGDKKIEALYGNLQLMKLGARRIENLPVVVLNLEFTCFSDDVCVNGVLGVDFLSQQRIGFNFVKRKLYIWK